MYTPPRPVYLSINHMIDLHKMITGSQRLDSAVIKRIIAVQRSARPLLPDRMVILIEHFRNHKPFRHDNDKGGLLSALVTARMNGFVTNVSYTYHYLMNTTRSFFDCRINRDDLSVLFDYGLIPMDETLPFHAALQWVIDDYPEFTKRKAG